MAVRVELAKELITEALTQAKSLRLRQIKGASNKLIKAALEDELSAISKAADTITEIK